MTRRRRNGPGPGNGDGSSDAPRPYKGSTLSPPRQRRAARSVKDKSYRALPLGQEAGHYLRAKRKRLTASSYRDYESCLDKLARYFADLEIEDFEPPVGTERVEEFLDAQWGESAGRTYNKNLIILRDFFKFQVLRGKLHGDPTLPIERAKKRGVYRTTFSGDQRRAIIAAQPELRDRIALRLLLDYGLRKGALQGDPVQALRPPPQAADGVHEGREGPRHPDPAPGVLARPRAADPRDRGASRSHYLMPRQQTHPVTATTRRQGGRVPGPPLPRPADGRPRPARLVVPLPRARRDRRAGRHAAASGCTRPGTPPANGSST